MQYLSTKDQIIVNVVTLDKFCEENDIQYIDYLKLDVQGFEPQCIDGAKNLIETKSIGVLRIEITPGNFYEKSFTLYEIEDRLSPYYQLYTVLGLHYGKKDNLLYFDAIFVKQN